MSKDCNERPDEREEHRETGKKKKHDKCPNTGCYSEMLATVAVVTAGLTEGRSDCELETLLNFINLLQENVKYVLGQRLIDQRRIDLDLDLDLFD